MPRRADPRLRCPGCGKRTRHSGVVRQDTSPLCRDCQYPEHERTLRAADMPHAPVGQRYAALYDVAPGWAVVRYVGRDRRIVRRQARLYRDAALRAAETKSARPDPQYVKRCGHCGRRRHESPTCPELHPERSEERPLAAHVEAQLADARRRLRLIEDLIPQLEASRSTRAVAQMLRDICAGSGV